MRSAGSTGTRLRGCRRLVALGLALAALLPRSALAADQPVAGRRLVLLQTAVAGRLLYLAKDALAGPTPGGPDDPRNVGAVFVVTSGTGETATLSLPAAQWTANATGTVFRYRNPLAPGGPSAVDTVVLKRGRFTDGRHRS